MVKNNDGNFKVPTLFTHVANVKCELKFYDKGTKMLRNMVTLYFLLTMAIGLSTTYASAGEMKTPSGSMLMMLENNAEKLVDVSLNHSTSGVIKYNHLLQRQLIILQKEFAKQPFNERNMREMTMLHSWFRVIQIDMKNDAWLGVAISANQLSGAAIKLVEFPSVKGRDLEWMDFLARDIKLLSLESAEQNKGLIGLRSADIGETWKRLSVELIKNFRNKTAVMQGHLIVSKLKKNADTQETVHLSDDLSALIEHFEKMPMPN